MKLSTLNLIGILLFELLMTISGHTDDGKITINGKITLKNTAGQIESNAENIVIFVTDLKTDQKFLPTQEPYQMASRNKLFEPMILPILRGSTVEFPNDDLIYHNVFSLSKTKPFDLGLYKKGSTRAMRFDESGLVKVYCNIHEKMFGYILVLDNPYFAISNKNGEFQIRNVPQGEFNLVAWQRFGDQVKKRMNLNGKSNTVAVQIETTKGLEVDFDLIEKDMTLKHKNKWGKEYKDKY